MFKEIFKIKKIYFSLKIEGKIRKKKLITLSLKNKYNNFSFYFSKREFEKYQRQPFFGLFLEVLNFLKNFNFYGIYNKCPPYEYDKKEINAEFKNIDLEESFLHSYKYSFLKMLHQQKYENYLLKNTQIIEKSLKNDSNLEPAIDYMPVCGDDFFIDDFLNDNTTKRKLGVDESIYYYQCAYLYYKWGESIDFYREDLEQLTKEGFKAWLFSGTEDIAVATLGTLRWINYSNFTVDEKWKQWYVDDQVAGMEQNYTNGLKIITVKGCGHMVPQDDPKKAKTIFDKFIENDS